MKAADEVSRRAKREVLAYLKSLPSPVAVKDVGDDGYYRSVDVDLRWTVKGSGSQRTYRIEIEGDRGYKTGNYFLETVSNAQRNTPGCFLYTTTDYVFYLNFCGEL